MEKILRKKEKKGSVFHREYHVLTKKGTLPGEITQRKKSDFVSSAEKENFCAKNNKAQVYRRNSA
ncbi:hypothetical protein JQM66_07625 [Oscillibacter valericigenes]|uniref:hypothetical protein n=1 Tax=Oscillibacter valericigenes TaxID=351091 RepID=UPI001F1D9E25|nr:hypothetical protein [Oscillibacter valericigenes]MCF2664432.1 hypothetical protein [Oscillibacter valericigenes]